MAMTIGIPQCLTNMERVNMPKDTVVFEPGANCNQFAFILSGKIRVDLLSRRGKPVMLYRFGGGETCILTTACLLSGDDYNAVATIEENVEAIVVPATQFKNLLASSPEFRNVVFNSFADRLSSMMVKIDEIAFVPVEHRIADRLMQLYKGDAEPINITHEQLASDVGTAREVVSRKLKSWERGGLITQERGKLSITSLNNVKKIAMESD
ncbi:Crp/Fnr family transcriptional regulator [Kordiimonas sp. SCSIO 12610]|uniref:Crp/Fnr family transcriptional regulator n=1 Tax=Kordiimonas sp. SCSIO 12610 TaxID=2829597 RepID=UPI00210DD0E5|nr:Crp/Fnr family transcriptional regulator [Kordiimonas sp. SCSIO 12610]UTW54654.1 Crp/Fnr family transcriptional regulator [Kordiimonas sp. SCSIO 12610]